MRDTSRQSKGCLVIKKNPSRKILIDPGPYSLPTHEKQDYDWSEFYPDAEDTGPLLNSSNGTLRITIQIGKRIAIIIINNMKLSKKVIHYIVNDYPYIQETVKAGENTYLSYSLNISKIIN